MSKCSLVNGTYSSDNKLFMPSYWVLGLRGHVENVPATTTSLAKMIASVTKISLAKMIACRIPSAFH